MKNEYFTDLSDEELSGLAQSGDSDAREYLFEKYKGLVKLKARAYFIAGADRDDLIQEGMIGLYNAVCDYRGDKDASFATFADLCVTRRVFTAIKAAGRQKHSPLNSYISYSQDGVSEAAVMPENRNLSPEDIVIAREEKDYIEHKLILELSQYEKLVLMLYLRGMSYIEIAQITDGNKKAVDNAIQRIRNKLKIITKGRVD